MITEMQITEMEEVELFEKIVGLELLLEYLQTLKPFQRKMIDKIFVNLESVFVREEGELEEV